MKYKAVVIEEKGKQWIEGYSFRPGWDGQWDNGFIPAHPEYGLEWAEREALKQCKECCCAILDGDNVDLWFEVMVEREDIEQECMDLDRYEFISLNAQGRHSSPPKNYEYPINSLRDSVEATALFYETVPLADVTEIERNLSRTQSRLRKAEILLREFCNWTDKFEDWAEYSGWDRMSESEKDDFRSDPEECIVLMHGDCERLEVTRKCAVAFLTNTEDSHAN